MRHERQQALGREGLGATTIVSFHWGHPPEHQVAALKAADSAIWVQVGTVEDAEIAPLVTTRR